MSPRALRALAGAFLILAAVWGGILLLERRRPSRPPLVADATRARRVVLIKGGARTVLVGTQAGGWTLEEPFRFPADPTAVDGLLEKLSKASSSELLSSDPSRHALFQVDPSSAIRMTLSAEDGKPLWDAFIGRPGADFDSFFFRREGEDSVHEARGLERYAFDRLPGTWADRVLCAVEPVALLGVEASSQKKTVSVRREGGAWLRADGVALSSSTVSELLQPFLTTLTRLEADSVTPEAGVHPFVLRGLATPEFRVVVRHLDAEGARRTMTLEVGTRAPEFTRPVKKSGVGGFVYNLADWRLASLRRFIEEFPNQP